MANFSDLPIELHCHLIYICALQGHSVLSKYALLSRQHFQLARPLLHTSVDLANPTYGPEALSQFIYHFAPHHRTDLQWLSIAFRPSPPRCPFDELDECLSQILSLLVAISDLEIIFETSDDDDDDDIEDSFLLTIQALQRFTRLRSLTLRGAKGKVCSPKLQLILEALPKLKGLDTLRLEGLTLVMPTWKRGATNVRALEISNCLVSEDPSVSSRDRHMGSFIDLFGPTLSVLRLDQLSTTPQALLAKFSAPLLSKLWLSDLKPLPRLQKIRQPQQQEEEEEQQEDCVIIKRRYWNLINQFALVGPIKQLVFEEPWISSSFHGPAKTERLYLSFSHLEDVVVVGQESACISSFLDFFG